MARYKDVIDAGGDPAESGARVRQAKASSDSPKSGSLAVIRLHTYSHAAR
jgi:hypothetical protein